MAFAHDASAGDPDNDDDVDIYACNVFLINDGLGNFTIHPYIGIFIGKSIINMGIQ